MPPQLFRILGTFGAMTGGDTDLELVGAQADALPETARLAAVELLAGPLDPADERRLAGPLPAEAFLEPGAW